LAFDRIDVRKVGGVSVLANDPEARRTPARPGIQSPLKVTDLAVSLGWLADRIQDRVISLNQRYKVCMVNWVGDTLPILVPVQQGLVMLQCALLGPETPGTDFNSLRHPLLPKN
jgi:hypothetical protein